MARRKAPVLLPGAVAGIDEAGRGPVMGPLVVAGVSGPVMSTFKALGCTDSKLLSPERRRALDRALRADSELRIEVRVVEADVLDAERRGGTSLNDIELLRFRDIAATLAAPNVLVDAADVDAARFGRGVAEGLAAGTLVVSEHKADVTYPVVGAASIVAKVARDAAVAALARRLERTLAMPLGSGYASDPSTQAFLAEWFRQFRSLPEGTRTTWATAQQVVAPKPVPLEAFGTQVA